MKIRNREIERDLEKNTQMLFFQLLSFFVLKCVSEEKTEATKTTPKRKVSCINKSIDKSWRKLFASKKKTKTKIITKRELLYIYLFIFILEFI